jgi:Uma2 family endonuclease
MLDLDAIKPERIRPLSRAEYDQLVELGVFQGESVELLRGMLVTMSPQGYLHGDVIEWLTRYLISRLDESFRVRPGLPFAATDDSEPEPDIHVSRAPQQRELAHPSTALLVIEVANSSIRKDRGIKMPLYAEAGVPEYWIIDISDDGGLVVEVYRDPTPTGYSTKQLLRDGDAVRPLHVPITIAIADLPH